MIAYVFIVRFLCQCVFVSVCFLILILIVLILLARVSTLTRDIDIAILSVCLSVCPSVRPELRRGRDETYIRYEILTLTFDLETGTQCSTCRGIPSC